MIIPDINLLIYAYHSGSPFHAKAAVWWQSCMRGNEPIGLAQVVVFGFLRITTNSKVFEDPMTPSEAIAHVRSWLQQPLVQLLPSDNSQMEEAFKLLEAVGTAGNLVTDAQIAAAAFDNHAIVHTSDSDFAKFPNLHWFNPITGVAGKPVSARS